MRIGIYGGSFNPIHNGHIAVAAELLKTGFVDEILFIVSPQNPLKQNSTLMPDQLRLEMTDAALKDWNNRHSSPQQKGRMRVSDIEFHLPKPSYMYDTLQEIARNHPDDEIILLIGADNWLCFQRWYRHTDILQNYEIGIYPRPGYPITSIEANFTPPANTKGITFLPTSLHDISSTEIRNLLSQGKSIRHLVPSPAAAILSRGCK